MKKIISILGIVLFISNLMISNTFAAPTVQQVKNLAVLEIKVERLKNGESYVKAFDAFTKKNWNNRDYLKDMKSKIEKVLVSQLIKDKATITILAYLYAKINVVMSYDLVK